MEGLQIRAQPSKERKFLLALLLLSITITAVGIYVISGGSLWRPLPNEKTPIIQGCKAIDVREFSDPIIIDVATNWTCVDYAVRNVTVTATGSLAVVNSSLRNLMNKETFLDDRGTLRILGSNVAFNQTINAAPIALRLEGGSAVIQSSQMNSLTVNVGSASIEKSQIDEVLLNGGLLTVSGSELDKLGVSGGNCSVSSSLISLLMLSNSQDDALTIDRFNQTRDAGNYDYTSWGLNNPSVRITYSTVEAVSILSERGTVKLRSSTLQSVTGSHFNVSQSRMGGVSVNQGGFGEVVNSTWGYATVDPGGVLILLNTTSTSEADTTIPYGTGEILFAEYYFVNTYDAVTRKPLSQVSIAATAATGATTSFSANGSTRVALVEEMQTGATNVAHEHGTFTQYLPYNVTATRVGYLATNTAIPILGDSRIVNIYMYPEK